MPTIGNASSQEAQDFFASVCQSIAAGDGNGTIADCTGLAGTKTVEIVNTGSGATTLTIEGSFDGVAWYACGYAQQDAQAILTRQAAGISVAASPFAHVYAVLDDYSRYRCRLSGSSGAPAVTATVRAFPV